MTESWAANNEFILNMTSDAKVRRIVGRVSELASRRVPDAPDMEAVLEALEKRLDDAVPLLPFSTYIITGTAGAGKSTCISALYQNLNCLISGATTVAAQNLSNVIRCHCPTIFHAFGFKGKHINLPLNPTEGDADRSDRTVGGIQRAELVKYWPVIRDICADFTKNKARGKFSFVNEGMMDFFSSVGNPTLWSTNVIVIDEAGTLSSHIFSAVVFLYWFFNCWLDTPLYRAGMVPCLVCVGSPTQTTAFESTFDHARQKIAIVRCNDILSFLISDPAVGEYADVSRNWALFINNKRCLDAEFGYLLKIMEYNLEVPEEVMSYVDRFVVPSSQILDPTQYEGWTRLFVSHSEVQRYIALLHSTLALANTSDSTVLFSCPIVCEIFSRPFEEYRAAINLHKLTPVDWLGKNLNRLSNYSQFADQDMSASDVRRTESSVRVTYLTKFVKNSSVSLNGKIKSCIFGFLGTLESFVEVLHSDSFIESHARDKPEQAYHLLNLLLYNGMYFFVREGVEAREFEYLRRIQALRPPPNLLRVEMPPDIEDLHQDVFYMACHPPPFPNSWANQLLYDYYVGVRDYFLLRLRTAVETFGREFLQREFQSFTANVRIVNGIEYVAEGEIRGVIEFATSVGSYSIGGYTNSPVRFGGFHQSGQPSDLTEGMPCMVLRDDAGFVCCLERNVTKLTENLEDGSSFHLCSVVDYGVSSKLAMTIVKSQGISLNKVAISFGNHRNVSKNLVYVAMSRTVDPRFLVMDANPLPSVAREESSGNAAKYIMSALNNPTTLLVY